MAFAVFDPRRSPAAMVDIDELLLIDVMLVQRVIFIVTAPLLRRAVRRDLPRASSSVNQGSAQQIGFAIDADGQRHGDGQRIDRDTARARFAAVPASDPRTEVHLQIGAKARQRQAVRDPRRSRQRRPDAYRLPKQPGALREGPVRFGGRRA